jgi:hypothetical protein
MKTRKIAWVLCLLLLILIGITACTSKPDGTGDANVKRQLEEDNGAADRMAEAYGEGSVLFGLQLLNDTDPTELNSVRLAKITDNLHITIQARIPHASNCALKLLLDYNEVEFMVDGKKYSLYPFEVKTEDSFEIPVNLRGDIDFSRAHILTVVVLPDYEEHAADGFQFAIRPLAMDFELIPESGLNDIEKKTMPIQPEHFLSIPYSGLMFNTDFNPVDSSAVLFPPKSVEVATGETVKMACYAGNYENTDDVLLYMFAGGVQVSLMAVILSTSLMNWGNYHMEQSSLPPH